MKAELRLSDHSLLPGHKTIEVWYDGKLIATVFGADGPGVRVISKHPLVATEDVRIGGIVARTIGVLEVWVDHGRSPGGRHA